MWHSKRHTESHPCLVYFLQLSYTEYIHIYLPSSTCRYFFILGTMLKTALEKQQEKGSTSSARATLPLSLRHQSKTWKHPSHSGQLLNRLLSIENRKLPLWEFSRSWHIMRFRIHIFAYSERILNGDIVLKSKDIVKKTIKSKAR